MNGFAHHGLDEDAFGEKRGNIVQAFDAFRTCSLSALSGSHFRELKLAIGFPKVVITGLSGMN